MKAITVLPHTPGSASLDDIPEPDPRGAGPIGLLAALVGQQHGFEVHVLDRVESGAKPDLVRALGAKYHAGGVSDIGVCLTGVGTGGRTVGQSTADIAAAVVLQNNVIVGSVNANKRHWYKAGQVLARADATWLARLLSRREKPEPFMNALHRQPDDIKVVVQFADA